MSPFKIIFSFGVKFLATYFLVFLIAVTTGFDDKVRDFCANSTVRVYDNLIDEAIIQTKPIEEEHRNLLYQIINKNKYEEIQKMLRAGDSNRMDIPTVGYKTNTNNGLLMPFIFLLSLIVAYPSSFRQKIIPLVLGSLLVWIFVFIQIGCSIIYAIDNSEQYFPSYELPNFLRYIVALVEKIFIEVSYIFTVLIWILVGVRLEDFKIKKR